MEEMEKKHPVRDFFKRLFEKLSESALFSVLGTNASSTIGDDYLEDDASLTEYKAQAAEEAGLSDTSFQSIDAAFRAAKNNLSDLETAVTAVPREKGKFEVAAEELNPDPQAEVVERAPATRSKGGYERDDLS